MAVLIRSVLSRFCYMVAFGVVLCQTPKATGIASVQLGELRFREPKVENQTPAQPNFTGKGRQVSVRLRSGVLAASVNWAVDDVTSLDLLRGYIEYRPDADRRGSCPNIRFVQVAKVERGGGLDYDWQGLEEHRNLLRTSHQMGPGVKPGYFVDHRASACVPGAPCSPYFRDYWTNARESRDGFQLGGRSAPASLVDYPFGWEVLEQISLESCARCAESGEFLGCVQWGARWPSQGRRDIFPIRIQAAPSQTFLAALRRFEEFYRLKKPSEPPRIASAF
jgi:hypothetical protein